MAEKVQLKVDLEANLGKVVEATKSLKLDKGQTERLEKYKKGAELAYANGDLKTFQKNFNNLMKLFKEAASVTGKVSDEIKKLTDKQSALNQEINRLKDKKTSLEGKLTKDRSRITVKAARDFASTNVDAKKVITGNNKIASRDEIIELQKALASFLEQEKKVISKITNEDLKQIKTSSGLTFGSRNAVFAANRYVKAENEYEASVKTDLANTENQIQLETNNYTNLSAELDRMSNSAKDATDDISKLYAEISKLGDSTNKEITDVVNEERINKTDRTGATQGIGELKGIEKQTGSLGKAFKQFTLYNVAIKAVKTAMKEAVQTIKELDKYLTEQAMVTGMTREQTYGLVKSYQDLALQCGATTKEIAEVSTEYMKQGKTIQESLILTEAAVKAAKVARVSVGDSVNYLTTALNGFQLSAEDAMKVSDKFAAVAAASATDYDELAIALSKVASQANLAGMSIDYTTALLTKGLETTREAPETMGTALKTIIARMRELGDYGETLEGDTDINNVESQLAYVGIALRDTNGELRSTEDVLDELGKKWDTLNKNQQAALAKALAGTRQQSRLIALMEDYERVTELQEISQRSAGATAAQAGVYLEGMEAALNKIQVA
jgi:TP901 family phage tail tape measure protein